MSNYRKTMAEALREMYPLTEEVELDEVGGSAFGGTIDKIQKVVDDKQATKIDGVMVDTFTASLIMKIWNGVSKQNQDKMRKMKVTQLAKAAYKLAGMKEEVDLDEASKLPPHLAKFFDKDGNLKKDAAARIAKGQQKLNIKDVTPKGYGPSEEADLDEAQKWVVYNTNNGKLEKEFSNKIPADRHKDKLNKKYEASGKLPYRVMQTEEVDLDEGTKQVLAHGGKGQYKAVRDGSITKVMYKGKVVGTADFDSGADSFFASIKGEKGQKSFDDAQAMVDYFAKNKIKEEDELDEYGGNFGGGPMRVTSGKKKKDKKEEIDEASARADAMKAMRKGKTVDPADVDNVASDEDIKAASKNIIMQLRKAVSLRSYEVEFADGKHKVDQKIAQAVQSKYNTMRRPADKEKYQMQIAKSYKDMLQSLKAGYGEQKESVLNRIGRKFKEKNNG